MRMAIDQPRDHHPTLAIEFFNFFAIRSQPWITQQFALRSSGQNLSSAAEHSSIFY